MRESIASTFLYNIIIIFIVLAFVFLAATLSYSKAFKVNSRIVNSIEKFEGYNRLSATEIDLVLQSIGYRRGPLQCKRRDGKEAMDNITNNFQYCVYYYPNDGNEKRYSYGIVTFMYIDIPIIRDIIKIPIYTRTDRLYRFDLNSSQSGR